MNKTLYLPVTMSLLAPVTVIAATSGSFDITGDVQAVTTITKNTETPMDLTSGDAVTDAEVVILTVNSNDPAGYTVTLLSANSSVLLDSSSNSIAYTLKYNGTAQDLSGGAVTVEDTTTLTFGEVYRPIAVSITAAETLSKPDGAYTDTVTFAIAAK